MTTHRQQVDDDMESMDLPAAGEALVASLIDYAGLFPPAKLDMGPAVANYAKYLRTPEAWMLGRFVVPVQRLEEFELAAAALGNGGLPTREPDDDTMPEPHEQPWPLSVLVEGPVDALVTSLEAIDAFNARHSDAKNGLACIDAIEVKCPAPTPGGSAAAANAVTEFIEAAMEEIPEDVFPFFEMPVSSGGAGIDARAFAAALAGADAGAKIRTGGVTPEAIPACEHVANFIEAMAAAEVPVKATAGLHHAVRAMYPLTYEPNCQAAVMHGFLNVFVAACMMQASGGRFRHAKELLAETDVKAIRFNRESIRWRDYEIHAMDVIRARESLALSFGSCSFDEPVQDIKRLVL